MPLSVTRMKGWPSSTPASTRMWPRGSGCCCRRVSIDSRAFLTRLVIAWVMRRRSKGKTSSPSLHVELDVDVGGGDALQHGGLAHDGGQILRLRHGLGHAGEGGELIHHAADVADLADDGVGALVEDVLVGLDLRAVFALQALGRELDGRQRVLDLMRDAARDVGPGGVALRRDEIGDVVEGEDVAVARRPRKLSVVTRAKRLRPSPLRSMSTWPSAKPEGRLSACSKMGRKAESTISAGWPISSLSVRPEQHGVPSG